MQNQAAITNEISRFNPVLLEQHRERVARRKRLGFDKKPTFLIDLEKEPALQIWPRYRVGPDEVAHVYAWSAFKIQMSADYQTGRRGPPLYCIASRVCSECDLEDGDLLNPSRKYKYSRPRQRFMYEAARDTHRSIVEIARFLKLDHTTVLHGMTVHARRNGLPPARESNFNG